MEHIRDTKSDTGTTECSAPSKRCDRSRPTLASRWQPWLFNGCSRIRPIVGASHPAQLADVVAAVASPIDATLKATLDAMTYEFRFGDNAR